MRIALVLSAAVFFLIVPCVLRRVMLARSSPAQLAWFGMITLGGVAASFVGLLGVLIAPEILPVTGLPKAMEMCLLAVHNMFAHPFANLLAISAALLLLVAIVRLARATISVWRHTRGCRLSRERLAEEEALLRDHFGTVPNGVRLLPTSDAIAFTTGVIRPQTVVSRGVLEALSQEERAALLAHELTHGRRHHAVFVFVATVLSEAFGFIPSIRVGVASLLTALEARADGVAARQVGDPLIVASALSVVARLIVSPSYVASVGGGDIRYRLLRLTDTQRRTTTNGLAALLLCFSVVALLSQGAAWAVAESSVSSTIAAIQLHSMCHPSHQLPTM